MHSAQDTTHTDDDAPVYMGLPHERVLRPRFLVALALTLPVLVLAMGSMAFPHAFHSLPPKLNGWLQLALTTPVFFWSGRFFIGRWWKSLRELDTNMFTLTVTGTGGRIFTACLPCFSATTFQPLCISKVTAFLSTSKPPPSSRPSCSSAKS